MSLFGVLVVIVLIAALLALAAPLLFGGRCVALVYQGRAMDRTLRRH